MYALMISAFEWRELQLSFYANETSLAHGIPCREGESTIKFYPQCFKNPEMVASTVESEHDKTNTMYGPRIILSALASAKPGLSSLSIDPWLPINTPGNVVRGNKNYAMKILTGASGHELQTIDRKSNKSIITLFTNF